MFVDTKIRVGQEWVNEIDRELRSAHHFVVLLSLESIRSDMVRREIALAHKLRKERKLTILPVRIGFDGELPYDLGAYLEPLQCARWSKSEPFDTICRVILQEIRSPGEHLPQEHRPNPTVGNAPTMPQATEPRSAPFPAADPRATGAVGLDSPFYIRRAEDNAIGTLILRQGVTVLVTGPRQVGKTSLLARAQARAHEYEHRTLYLDFQLIDESHFDSLKALLLYLAHRISKDLRTSIKPHELWDDALGATDSLTDFVEQAVLAEDGHAFSIVLDEADRVFQHKFRNAFFGMLRAWHNRRATNVAWNRLSLVIAHSTTPALFINDLNQSPFNVGEVLRLSDFTPAQVEQLNDLHGGPLRSSSEIADLMHLVGGHPYLLRESFYALRTSLLTIKELQLVALDEKGPFDDHLRMNLWALRDRHPLRQALLQVIREGRCSDELDFQRLRAAGILSGDSHENASMRCDLYRRYFARCL